MKFTPTGSRRESTARGRAGYVDCMTHKLCLVWCFGRNPGGELWEGSQRAYVIARFDDRGKRDETLVLQLASGIGTDLWAQQTRPEINPASQSMRS